MATGHIEERVAALEAEIVRLKRRLNQGATSPRPWWEDIAGGFANDPIFEQAMKLGQQYRRSLRPKPGGLRRKHDVGRQRVSWCSTRNGREHNVTVDAHRVGQAHRRPDLRRRQIIEWKPDEAPSYGPSPHARRKGRKRR